MSGAWSALRWKSPVGVLTVAGEGDWVTGLWIEGQKYFGASAPGLRRGSLPVLEEARRWLERYFAGEEPGPTPALAPHGTPFQQSVWSLLRTIPRGETVTYGTLAQRLSRAEGRTTSPRAVGSAVGRNPISILIPCHRVVGADGSLTGYAGGVEKKEWLLELEKAI